MKAESIYRLHEGDKKMSTWTCSHSWWNVVIRTCVFFCIIFFSFFYFYFYFWDAEILFYVYTMLCTGTCVKNNSFWHFQKQSGIKLSIPFDERKAFEQDECAKYLYFCELGEDVELFLREHDLGIRNCRSSVRYVIYHDYNIGTCNITIYLLSKVYYVTHWHTYEIHLYATNTNLYINWLL